MLTYKDYQDYSHRAFDSKRTHQYYDVYFARYMKGKIFSWNWGAALFGHLWFWHRYMPFWGLLDFFFLLIAFQLLHFDDYPLISQTLAAFLFIVRGLCGNYCYAQSIESKKTHGKSPLHGRKLSIAFFFIAFIGIPVMAEITKHAPIFPARIAQILQGLYS